MPLGSGPGTLSRLPSSRRCSPSHRPSPHAKPPKLLAVPEPAAPDPGSQILPWARAERGGSRQDARPGSPVPGAASGVVLAPPPLRARPVPKEDTLLPPAGSPPPRRRLPRPPARPRWPRAAPAASERGSKPGMGPEEAANEETAAAPWLLPGSHERSPRGEPARSGDEASGGRPGGCAPVSFPGAGGGGSGAAGEQGALSRGSCSAPRPPRRGRPTDPYRPTDEQIGRLGHPRARRRCPAGWRPAPAARRPQTTTSCPGPCALTPRGRQSPERDGGAAGPRLGQSGRRAAGRVCARPRVAGRPAQQPPRGPVGALCLAAGRPDPDSTEPGKGRLEEHGSAVIPVLLASDRFRPRLGGLGLFTPVSSAFCSWFSMELKLRLPLSYVLGKGKKGVRAFVVVTNPRTVRERREK